MKTSELIEVLKVILEAYGDRESGIYIEDYGYTLEGEMITREGIIIEHRDTKIEAEYEGD